MPAAFDTPRALGKALDKAATEVRGLDEASADLGAVMVALARRLCPKQSGTLRASIAFKVGRPSKRLDSVVRISAGGARVPYAPPIHWGWHRRHIRKQPFLMDALGRVSDSGTITDTYRDKVQQILTHALP